MKYAVALGLSALLAIAGCGTDTDNSLNTQVLRTFAASAVSGAKPATQPSAPMTRATLATVVTPVMLVRIDSLEQEALIAEIQTNGAVATWSSVDDLTISLKNGVIVATRGFGADLMAAAVPSVSRSSGGGQTNSRVHTLLNGEDQAVRTQFACTMQNAGLKAIDIVEVSYQATHVIETCSADEETFKNEYWFSSDQKMRMSRQWISPDVGYLTIKDVRR